VWANLPDCNFVRKKKTSKVKVKTEHVQKVASYVRSTEVIEIHGTDSDTDSEDIKAEVKVEVDSMFNADTAKVEPADALQKLKDIDATCQHERKEAKKIMSVKKVEAAKEKSAKEKTAKEKKANEKAAKAKKAEEKAAKTKKAKEKKANEKAAKAKKAEEKAAKTKTEKAKKKKAKEKSKKQKTTVKKVKTKYQNGEIPVQVGMRVNVKWKGGGPQHGMWFNGKVIASDPKKETAHIMFDDGDEDTCLNWFHISIIDPVNG